MPSHATLILLASPVLALAGLVAFLVYVIIRYSPIIGRIFEEKPLFLPLRLPPCEGGEEVHFTTAGGLAMSGTYFRARTESRVGVLVFCHEYLSDRWSFQPYADPLRDLGFDLFTFDFRHHGTSHSSLDYRPLQWVTNHEVDDLRAALDYLRSRPDRDPTGFGLFGISRGGSTALVVAADAPDVWGVVTDGAFPTHGTMLAYILRWAEIYVGLRHLWKYLPLWIFRFVGWIARLRSEARLNCRFPNVEHAIARLAPRPWLMIHGAKDAYIGPEIAQRLFDLAHPPKEAWFVPGAKHNRCREVQPEAYGGRIASFFQRYAPRRLLQANPPRPAELTSSRLPGQSAAVGLAAPVSG